MTISKMNPHQVWFDYLGTFSKEDKELFERFSAGQLAEKDGRPTTRRMTEEREKTAELSRRLATLHAQLFGTDGPARVRLGPDTRVGPSSGLQLEGEVSSEEILRRLDPWVRMRSVLHDA